MVIAAKANIPVDFHIQSKGITLFIFKYVQHDDTEIVVLTLA